MDKVDIVTKLYIKGAIAEAKQYAKMYNVDLKIIPYKGIHYSQVIKIIKNTFTYRIAHLSDCIVKLLPRNFYKYKKRCINQF